MGKAEDRVQSELKGNTLRVYLCALKSPEGKVGVREVQRKLHFSSPNLALYHLEKLNDLGLVENNQGEYHLVKEVKVDTLRQFTKLGTLMVPRYTLYAVLFTVLLVYFLINLSNFSFYSLYALIFGGLATAIMWYETIRTWLERP